MENECIIIMQLIIYFSITFAMINSKPIKFHKLYCCIICKKVNSMIKMKHYH